MDKILYLFSSTSTKRALYREDAINALCFPPGFIIHFRYDTNWVSEEINEDLEYFKGYETLIVIADEYKSNNYHFYPIRKAKIKKVEKDGDFFHIYFKLLGEWVDYRESESLDELKSYHNFIMDINENPCKNMKFASVGLLNTEIKFSKDTSAWASIIEKIGNKESYKNVLFYRINGIYELDSRSYQKIATFGDSKVGYALKAGKKYIMDISLNYGKETPKTALEDRLIVNIDENHLFAIPNEIKLGFRADKQDVYLPINESLQDSITYLTINFKEGNIEGPNVIIPIKITYNRIFVYILIFLFLLGTILSSGLIANIINIDQITQNILKIVGSVISTIVIFKLFRQLK